MLVKSLTFIKKDSRGVLITRLMQNLNRKHLTCLFILKQGHSIHMVGLVCSVYLSQQQDN